MDKHQDYSLMMDILCLPLDATRRPIKATPFFSCLHPLIHHIKDSCKLLLHAWYINDETLVRDLEEVAKALLQEIKHIAATFSQPQSICCQ